MTEATIAIYTVNQTRNGRTQYTHDELREHDRQVVNTHNGTSRYGTAPGVVEALPGTLDISRREASHERRPLVAGRAGGVGSPRPADWCRGVTSVERPEARWN
jgi:hypothetical protein